jgi:hypothetical protein
MPSNLDFSKVKDFTTIPKNGIGNLAIGWNQGFKFDANMGKLNDRKFVQMPLGKLKNRLRQLCNLHGIRFLETEEAYRSKASFIDGDSPPRSGEKPSEWKASEKRIKRGLYRSADGVITKTTKTMAFPEKVVHLGYVIIANTRNATYWRSCTLPSRPD